MVRGHHISKIANDAPHFPRGAPQTTELHGRDVDERNVAAGVDKLLVVHQPLNP